jgi:hypothetical protein
MQAAAARMRISVIKELSRFSRFNRPPDAERRLIRRCMRKLSVVWHVGSEWLTISLSARRICVMKILTYPACEVFSLAAVCACLGCGMGLSTGQQPQSASTHQVSLSWTPSSSPNISGYNIYRAVYGASCGPFSKINPELVPGTSYTDTGTSDGMSYCYATTAVNTSAGESGYSNIVPDIRIPPP